MKPSWDDAPDWANYLAQDYDLEWWFYEEEPEARGLYWASTARCEISISPQVQDYWTDTLERRQ